MLKILVKGSRLVKKDIMGSWAHIDWHSKYVKKKRHNLTITEVTGWILLLRQSKPKRMFKLVYRIWKSRQSTNSYFFSNTGDNVPYFMKWQLILLSLFSTIVKMRRPRNKHINGSTVNNFITSESDSDCERVIYWTRSAVLKFTGVVVTKS